MAAASLLCSIVALTSAGCADAAPSIVGVWSASDGSVTKTITEDGQCSGMYYNGTEPLDIGGGMSCTLSDAETDGRYTLVVRQPPNQASYQVAFDSDDQMTVYTSGGTEIVTLTRQ
ncbi:hypothetical protein [Aeromicrobium fastidiosum]|uniref:Lipoprotein n=1 Tax=Aeromicrobium fastidiosum TaxID=52699 RepID=A0A641AQW0_9ACTN|nr:hypothetical protein [Aeromicrobium fastidiosum]KAA1380494.1 hypothetical protein ESP62_004765 [Aeromicrobium fastidiosum]MBP2390084.1 uncharacterized protein (DUF2147 family) [Aeromicrobium fastidiosum]